MNGNGTLENLVEGNQGQEEELQSYRNHRDEALQYIQKFENMGSMTEKQKFQFTKQLEDLLKSRGFIVSEERNNLESAFKKFIDWQYGHHGKVVKNFDKYVKNEVDDSSPGELLAMYNELNSKLSNHTPQNSFGEIDELSNSIEEVKENEKDWDELSEELAEFYSKGLGENQESNEEDEGYDENLGEKLKEYLKDHYKELEGLDEVRKEYLEIKNNELGKEIKENKEEIEDYCNETAESVVEDYESTPYNDWSKSYNLTKDVVQLTRGIEEQKKRRAQQKQQMMQRA